MKNMNFSIDEIMDMLDWNNTIDVQSEGRALAKNIRCINVFILPGHEGHCKNVWDNCARILADRSDEELRPYVWNLLEWLTDMNWPGAFCILDRLKEYDDREWLNDWIEVCIKQAKAIDEEMWVDNLLQLKRYCEEI